MNLSGGEEGSWFKIKGNKIVVRDYKWIFSRSG